MTALANLPAVVDATGALKVTVVAQTLPLTPEMALANLQGRVDATGALVITGAAAPPLSGNGPPVSGPGGTAGAFLQPYGDTSQTPTVVYVQIALPPANPQWMSLQSGVVV